MFYSHWIFITTVMHLCSMVNNWNIGILEYWNIGILEYWNIGILEYWNIGILEFKYFNSKF